MPDKSNHARFQEKLLISKKAKSVKYEIIIVTDLQYFFSFLFVFFGYNMHFFEERPKIEIVYL